MNRLKLQIQFFSSTNETTHYNLSQYIGTDKPTYLVDYNSDMSKIDTGIYDADAKGTQANNNIGNMSNLTTTATTDLVSAINEVDAHADTNATNISNNTTDIATNTSAIGTLANLNTTAKTNLVSAVNEVDAIAQNNATNISKFNLSNVTSYNYSDLTPTDCSISSGTITVATNDDYSIMKVYGKIHINSTATWTAKATIPDVIPLAYRPSSDITISPAGTPLSSSTSQYLYIDASILQLIIKTDGSIVVNFSKGTNQAIEYSLYLIPFLIFVKDFGDVPVSQ